MKYRNPKTMMLAGLAVASLLFANAALAEGCFNPFGSTDNSFVTPYGGADLSCPSTGSSQVYKECVFNFKNNGNVDSMSMECVELGIDITEASNSNGLVWESSAGVPNSGVPAYNKIDAILTDSAQGGKGCLYSFGVDQSSGAVGFQRSNGNFFSATRAVFCSDQIEEVTAVAEPPAVVEECVIPQGQSKEIYGVTFSCPEVGPGELRTIIVVEDTECDETGGNCSFVPGFGFLGTSGTIDFNNVCQCQGPAVPGTIPDDFGVVAEECDLNPDGSAGDCVVEAGAEVPVDVSIQNPKCFTVRGKRKCF